MELIQTYFLPFAVVLYSSAFVFFIMRKYRLESTFAALGLLAHTVYLSCAGYFGGIYLFLKVVENTAFLPWVMAFMLVLVTLMDKDRQAWGYNLLFIILFSFVACLKPPSMAYFGPNKHSISTVLFFITEAFAQGLFYIGGMMALMFLARKTQTGRFHGLLVWGFVFHTLSHVFGGYWCFLGWAAIFQWVYVHLRSAAVWLYYANYLHLKFVPWWNEKRSAYYGVAGAVILLVFKYT